MAKQRNVTVDVLKGLAIITVVLIHVFRGEGLTATIIGEVGRWAVPAFFMIQGFYLHRAAQQPWRKLAAKKIRRIYLPFLVCSAAYGFYFLWYDGKTFTVADVFLGETAVHLYFVMHYMLFALALPFLYRLSQQYRTGCLWVMIISNFVLCLALELQRTYGLTLITYSGFSPAKWWGFVALGMLLAERNRLLAAAKKHRRAVILGAGCLAAIGAVLPFLTGTLGYMYNRASLFPLAIGMTVCLAAIFADPRIPGRRALAAVGQKSFGIYLIHFFVVHCLKFIVGLQALWLVAVLTLGICLAAIELHSRFRTLWKAVLAHEVPHFYGLK